MSTPDVVDIAIVTRMDNNVWYMDVFGSWVEFGMALMALAIGAAFVWLAVRKHFNEKRLQVNGLLLPNSYFWQSHTRINEILTELRVKTDAGRSQVVQFHNTGYFLDGISMKKMSLTHESLTNGVSSEFHIKKDLLLSMCVDGLNLLTRDTPELYITEQLNDSWCKQLLQNSNVVSFAFLPLRRQTTIVGYVMVQWGSWTKTDDVDEEVVSKELEHTRKIIEVQLSLEKGGNVPNVRC